MIPQKHQWATRSTLAQANNLQEERRDLAEGTGVVSAKYPPTVKLELFSTLEC